jgi:elongation factor Ts
MAEIAAAAVKQLRDRTGAGMMDCKAALTETGGDMEAAVDWLRAKGLAKAAKKAGRVAAEGLIGVATAQGAGAVVEVNSETDFVARNDAFQDMVRTIARLALDHEGDVARLSQAPYPGADATVAEHLTQMVATIGENMTLRRAALLRAKPGVVASYVHNQVAPGLGKIGVLVALRSEADADKLAALGRQIAMHVAAAHPLAVRPEELPAEVVARERQIFAEQARESGKPETIIEKMVEGRVRKFYEEAVLLAQTWVIDNETKVEKVLEQAGKDLGAKIEVAGFVRFAIGEGIEKEPTDFASEVAQAAGR